MTEGPVLRNHWSLVASNTVKSAVTMAFVLLVTLSVNDLLRPDVYLAALGAVSFANRQERHTLLLLWQCEH